MTKYLVFRNSMKAVVSLYQNIEWVTNVLEYDSFAEAEAAARSGDKLLVVDVQEKYKVTETTVKTIKRLV